MPDIPNLTEAETRKRYIDSDLTRLGWILSGPKADVQMEYAVTDMAGVAGQAGFVDYVLFGADGRPLAVIEAKKASKDPKIGQEQAKLYADCLEKKFGRRPVMFTTNGFETYYWDDKSAPPRKVSGLFSKNDLDKLIKRREETARNNVTLNQVPIDENITGRYYQMEAIRAVCDNISKNHRKSLLVMATGTGKTRTAASLTDVLSRAGYVTNVLFLADRTALVDQANDAFKEHLKAMSLCNLCRNKDDRSARVVFSTYSTILNAIDKVKSEDGNQLFTPAHFDLIIIDESHRSIFKKYRAIFEYFDALLVGLTATPKDDVDHNTYDFFDLPNYAPTYAYDYTTAEAKDHVLVPYHVMKVTTKFQREGIKYKDLSQEDKEQFDEKFTEDDPIVENDIEGNKYIDSNKLNKYVFNTNTVDTVLQNLMQSGIKVNGDQIGKTIIFAQSTSHADFIVKRFNILYPQFNGKCCKRVVCADSYSKNLIDEFKIADSDFRIAVSVDMMDTGIDVPECVNLIFFKAVFSKTKFWQMIGRGTRTCRGLQCLDGINGEYTDKSYFLIFDYCQNFEFFSENQNGFEMSGTTSLTESIFRKRTRLAGYLQEAEFISEKYQNWRKEIVDELHKQVSNLNPELSVVRLQRQYVEKYRIEDAFKHLADGDIKELCEKLASLVFSEDTDEMAKRFDNLIFGLCTSSMLKNIKGVNQGKGQLIAIAKRLRKKFTIPQVAAKAQILSAIADGSFLKEAGILDYEQLRKELRDLMKFLETEGREVIITSLKDENVVVENNLTTAPAYSFETYRQKVESYLKDHADSGAILKLRTNEPLNDDDRKEIENILVNELGSKEDYDNAYAGKDFGLMIREVVHLDHDAAMKAFSAFINDHSLNPQQIDLVKKVISHIELNGYMDSPKLLMKAPFSYPVSWNKLFNPTQMAAIISTINSVKRNAMFLREN